MERSIAERYGICPETGTGDKQSKSQVRIFST